MQATLVFKPAMSLFKSIKLQSPRLIRLLHWEYWSFGVVYAPIYLYWLYLGIRCRSFFFFNAANPTIENGGFLMERKSDIYNIIPQQYYPKTILVNPSTNNLGDVIINAGFNFPLIVKPDIGGKGRGVKKIENIADAISYLSSTNFPMLVQEFVPFENEVGIFYCRMPWETKGKITGIVEKEYVKVTGDGISSITQLLEKKERFVLQLNALQKDTSIDFEEVLAIHEVRTLSCIGNHARGSRFLDITHKTTGMLEANFDAICQKIPHFYFGRLDIKYNNWLELEEGNNLSIIELNGAGSEPTHMYDPTHSIFFAWKEIIKHLNILAKISRYNKKTGIGKYLTFKEGVSMFKENAKVEKILDSL
jgi:hypothetical protein